MLINYSDFEKVDIRVEKIIKVEDFPEARKQSLLDKNAKLGSKLF